MVRLWNASQTERSRIARGLHDGPKVEALITIQRPIAEVFQYCHDARHLPRIIPYLAEVQPLSDDHSRWVWRTSQGQELICHLELISEIENRMISWQTLPDSPIYHAGSIWFRTSPEGELNGHLGAGTEVHVLLRYTVPDDASPDPEENEAAHHLGKKFQAVVELSLQRLKKLLELKEAVTIVPPPSKEKLH